MALTETWAPAIPLVKHHFPRKFPVKITRKWMEMGDIFPIQMNRNWEMSSAASDSG
jgi:hypothetical protein